MKLVVFGTGMIVYDFIRAVDKLPFEEVYLCGRNKEKVDFFNDKFNLDKIFYDYKEALLSDADVAYIGLPNSLHFEYAKNSLEAGKHVIVEKPFMTTFEQTEQIFDIAKRENKFVMEASLVFYFPGYKSLVKDLPSLGEIHLADCNFSQYSTRYERFLKGDIAPVLDKKYCGGALMDLNIYSFNLLSGLFGKPENVLYFSTIKKDIDVSGIAVLDYGRFKASCIASKSTSAPKHVTIQGEFGTVYLEGSIYDSFDYIIEYNDGNIVKRKFKDANHRMYYEFIEFIRIINEEDDKAYKKQEDICKLSSSILDECRMFSNIS